MSEWVVSSTLEAFIERGRIEPRDVLAMRQSVFADGVICKDEAVGLFAVHTNCHAKCREWDEFFVEAVSDFIVGHVEPVGYVSEKQAKWLISAVSRGRHVASRAELELLVAVLEKAKRSPDVLSAFVLSQVADAVIEHKGPLADDSRRHGVISARDVSFIRRVLHAFGGDGCIGVTKAEAEVLFRLNDQSLETENDPSWSDLFVKSIANYMMAVSRYTVPTREEALRREAWLDSVGDGRSFFSRMMADGLAGIMRSYLEPVGLEQAAAKSNAEFEKSEQEAAIVTEEEARWLIDRIKRDGYVRSNEKLLIAFLKAESTNIHPALKPLADMAA
jgi:hypothetical protein